VERNSEKGVVIILCVFLLPVIIIMLALAIDVGIYFLHRSSMQQAADAATLAAVQRFQTFRTRPNNPGDPFFEPDPSPVEFMDVKLVILAMFRAQAEIITNTGSDEVPFRSRGLRSINQEGVDVLTRDGQVVFFDFISTEVTNGLEDQCQVSTDLDLNYAEHTSNCARFGNILTHVTRGSRCYDNGIRYFCSLENLQSMISGGSQDEVILNSWQWANAIEMNMRADGINSFFARYIMGDNTINLSISSTSYLPLNPPECGHPACTDVFGLGPGEFGTIPAGVCRPIQGFN
jgi:hypothetical protein